MATSSSSILEVVQHYQRSIERCQDDEERLLHCITKLYKVPIKVEHLQETGIGKTVNSLRKFNGEIGVAAKALVTKWKAMVAAEEEPMETNCTRAEDEVNTTNGRRSSDDDQFDDNRNNRTESREPHRQEQKSTDDSHRSAKEKDRHRRKEGGSSSSKHTSGAEQRHESSSKSKPNSSQDHEKKSTEKHHKSRERSDKPEHKHREEKREKDEASTSSHHKSTSSSSSKRREDNSSDGHHSSKEKSERKESKHEKHSSSKDKDKHGSRKTKEEHLDKTKSSSKDKEQQAKEKPSSSKHHASSTASTSHSSSSTSASERKRSHHTVEESVESKSPNAKIAKVQKVSNNNNNNNGERGSGGGGDDGIDSSMGANFADVLGMLNMPTKKSKKSLANTSKSPVAASTSASTSKENSNKSLSSSKMNGSKLFSSPAAVTTSTYSPDVKPDLLSSTAKLEPLDPNIALELPHITNNYKPLPRNQTVMDCVFNTNTSSASTRPVRTLTDAEAYSHGISSKTMRTKIYSGVRTGQILQVPSLFDLCIRVLQKNIDALEYTGGVPFEVLRPVLERATPHQLLVFEEYNPYLMEDSDVLWQLHVQRTYRVQKRQEMESWREMFLRCQEDQERKLSILAESIKQSQKIIAAPVRKTQLAFVDSMVKPPRNVQRKQEQYGTKSKLIATPASRVASLSSVTPNAAKSGDTRLRIAAATARDPAQVSHSALRQKKAPLMAKTLQFMRRKR